MKKFRVLIFIFFLIALCLCMTSCGGAVVTSEYGEELISNGSFEILGEESFPEGWYTETWKSSEAEFNVRYYDIISDSQGEKYIEIKNSSGNKSMVEQTVDVEPGAIYKVSALINVPTTLTTGADGASIVGAFIGFADNISYTEGNITYVTDGFMQYTAYVQIDGMKNVTVCCQLGSNGHTVTGAAYFDNVSFTKVQDVPSGYSKFTLSYYNPSTNNVDTDKIGGIVFIILGVIASLVLAAGCYVCFRNAMRNDLPNTKNTKWALLFILCAAFLLRLVCGLLFFGYVGDIDYGFKPWALALFDNGAGNFYANTGSDYTPGYLYVLWLVGALIRLTNASGIGAAFIVKLPAIICDLVSVLLIYRIVSKHSGERVGLICAAFYAIIPVVLTNSAVWGQMDSVLAMLLLLTFGFLLDKNYTGLFISYTVAVAVKIQAAFALPAIGVYLIYIFIKKPELRKRLLITLGCCILGFFVIAMPFGNGNPFYVFSKYASTVGQYNYYTLNSFNLYGMLGLNFVDLPNVVSILNWVFIALVFAAVVFLYLKNRNRANLILLAAFTFIMIFTFSVKMHERYLFPAIILLVLYCGITKEKRVCAITAGFALLHFLNMALMLYTCNGLQATADNFVYGYLLNGNQFYTAYRILSGASVALALYAAYVIIDICLKGRQKAVSPLNYSLYGNGKTISDGSKGKSICEFEGKTDKAKWNKFDFIAITVLVVAALFCSFFELGDTTAAQSYWSPVHEGEFVTVNIEDDSHVAELWAYYGISRDANEYVSKGTYTPSYISVYASVDGVDFVALKDKGGESAKLKYEQSATFCWIKLSILENNYKYYKFVAEYLPFNMNELALIDADGNRIAVEVADYTQVNITNPPDRAFDEQSLVPKYTTYKTSMYFDEIFHARTAYEYLHGINNIKEDTHPPLGKILIEAGIAVFGMTPFGWRFSGALFAAALVPLMYVFGKELFKKTKWALLLAVMTLCCGINLAQGRIATVDTFAVFFIVLSYYFMLKFYKRSFNAHSYFDWLLPLCLAGLSFGIGIAIKWTGVYAGAGLLAIYLIVLFKRYKDYRTAKDRKTTQSGDELCGKIIETTRTKILYSVLACAVCFIIIPFFVYLLSYIPYANCEGTGLFETMWNSQKTMLSFHGNLKATHGWSSEWYSWPLDIKPVWFYGGDGNVAALAESMNTVSVYARIYTTGNQVLWYTMLLAFLMFAAYAIIRKFYVNSRLLGGYATANWEKMKPIIMFLFIGIAANFLPWVLIQRCTFFYHYYATVPFMSALAVYMTMALAGNATKPLFTIGRGKRVLTVDGGSILYVAYFALIVINFIMIFPLLTGIPIRLEDARWMFGWLNGNYGA